MDSFETRNDFAGSDNSENQAADMQADNASTRAARSGDVILQPDANGVVELPAGISLDDLSVQGRDLVIVMEDGSRIIIPEGAIIVPQIVVDGVTVPAANLAALLTGNEPQPAAGDPQSSGGNFEVDPGNIQDAYAIGNLLPYTELQFPQPEEREIIPYDVEEDPVIVIETPDNPVGVINAMATVDEDGLPARTVDGVAEAEGTREATDSETATGTIVFNAPDGTDSVLINGVAITEIGQTFEGAMGTLTITSIDLANGEIGFSYTLGDNMVGGGLDGSFVMTVVDTDGDRADATLQINVIDDAPIARDDTGDVAAGTHGPITGDVLVNDESGADSYAAEGAVSGFSNAGGSAQPGDTLVGEYGELTLNSDGTYSYTRFFNTPGGVSETFDYTIVDSDGSTSTATLTINIGDAPDAVTGVPTGEDQTVVDEGQLPPTTGTRDDEPQGSDFDGDTETATGTITFVSPDGVGSVNIGGTVVDPDNLPQVVVSDDTGTLTVIDYTYDPATGEGTITYVYELTDNTGDTDGTTVDFPIVITDLDGDTAEDDLVITIVDDTPEALDDFATQGSENASITVDVIDNDTPGADGVDLATGVAVVDGSLSGGGTLTYNGDGTFTYAPAPGEEAPVTFDYTITDGDGDTSTATVTITLQPDSTPEIGVNGEGTVFEEALAARDGEPAGSNEASDGELATGTINIATGGDSIASLVINGVDVTGGGTVTTASGVLTVTLTDGQYGYSYELTDNTLTDPSTDAFTLVVTDSDGDTAQTTLVLTIVDDNPAAADDANSIAAGEYGPVAGNVIANDTVGADDADVTSFTGANGTGAAGDTIQGEYGTLTIEADGSYTYTRNPGTDGGVSDTFSYTITDGDGDTATANLVIAIADSPVTLNLPVVGGDGTLVDEAGLPAGSDAASDSELTSGTFTYDAPDGPATVTIDGQEVTMVGQTITGSFGTLTITSIAEGAIGYSYELTTNTSGDNTFDSFAVVVTDQDGDIDSGNLDIAIVDDVPTAIADTDSVTEDGPLTADGNVITNAEANGDMGADTTGADGATVTAVEFGGMAGTVDGATAGAYGSLVLNADGSYTYTLDNTNAFVQGLDSTESLTEVFTYTLTDGDGDESVTTLTVTINGADDIVTINGLDLETPELTVDEDDLADGSSPDAGALTQSGQFTVDSPDGLSVLTVGGVQVWGGGETYPIEIPGAYGTVRITGVTPVFDANGDVVDATVSYEYTLSDNTLVHDVAGQDSLIDSLEVVATDTDGSQDSASLDIAVIDDVPTAVNDTAAQGAENASITIDALANDVFGADGVDTTDVADVFVATQPTQGTVTYDATTGLFTYTPTAGAGSNGELTDSFTYTIVDQDGDSSTATVTVTLQPDSEPSGATVTAAVDDDGLPAGNPDSVMGDLDTGMADESVFNGTLSFDVGNDTPATISFDAALDGSTAMLGAEMVTYSVVGTTLTASSARGEIFTVEITDTATGTYTVTLLQNVLHADGMDENDALASIDFTVADSEGETATATLDITFDDDAPTATDNTNAVVEGMTASGNILTDDDGFGVDVNGADGSLTILDVTGAVSSDNGAPFVVTGLYGELTVFADGGYSYESFANATNADVTDSFAYRIIDADGDIAEATLDIAITNVAGNVADNDVLVNEAGLATGSDAASDSEIDADGQITVTDAIGPFTFSLDGAVAGPGANEVQIDGTYGTIVLNTETGAYTYTLDTAFTDMVDENGTNTVLGAESFDYEVRDTSGNLIGSDTIVVNIIDDIPTATDQAQVNVAEDAAAIGGNVMTDGTPDTEGADGAMVTAITVGGTTTDLVDGEATVITTNGTYTIQSNGDWTFDPNPNLDQTNGPIVADFSYTLTDGDGDFDTATQPIRITDGADPMAGPDISLTVDDQNLADGSTPGATTDSDTITFTEGSDDIASIVFGGIGALDGGLTWTRVSDTQITGSDGGRLVVTLDLSVTNNVATVTATLNDNYDDHPTINVDDLVDLGDVDVIATDIDGDTASATVSVAVSDDLPSISATDPAADSLSVDETDFDTDATADFSTLFTSDFNADNPGTPVSYALALGGTATGLTDTLSGEAVVLGMNNGVVEGRTALGGDLVFTITVDSTGIIEFDQLRAVQHDDTADHNDAEPVPGWAADLITLTATIVDSDGDTASATADIGGAFQILDDGPTVSATLAAGASVVVDETDLVAAAASIDLGATYTQGSDSDVSGSPTLIGATTGANVLSVTADFGADSDVNGGGLTYSLTVGNGGASGVTTTDGTAITLVAVSDTVVVGVVDGTNTAAFAVEIDPATGVVSVEQYLSVQHDNPLDPDEALTPETLAAGSLNAVVTAQDGDGDTAQSAAIDIGGIIAFEDDGPAITSVAVNSSVEVDETDAGSPAGFPISDTSAAAIISYTGDFGADGAAAANSVVYRLDITEAATGLQTAQGDYAITLVQDANTPNVITGVYNDGANDLTAFTLTINANGTVTLEQNVALEHLEDGDNSAGEHDDTLDLEGLVNATVTLTDGDGDSVSQSEAIGNAIEFRDDGPSAANDTDAVTEDTNTSASGNVVTGVGEDGNAAGADSYGADGAGAVTAIVGTAAGAIGGNTQGSYGTLTIDASGNYTYTLSNGLPAVQGLGAGDTLTDTFTYTITDADGDTSTATLDITINGTNDAPVVGADVVATSDEGLLGGNPDSVGTPDDTTNSNTASGQVNVSDTDGDTLEVTLGLPTVGSLSSGGDPVQWSLQDNDTTLVGYTNDVNDPVVTVTIADDGSFTVNQLQQIDHPTANVEDVLLTSLVIPVTANDGTTSTTNTTAITVAFEDDSPIIGSFTPGTQTIPNEDDATAEGTFSYSPGGDGHGSFSITGTPLDGITYQSVTQTMLDLDGDGVMEQGAVLVGATTDGNTPVFQFAVDVEGNYEFQLLEPDAGTTTTVSLKGLTPGGPTPFVQTADGLIEFTANGSGVNSSTPGFGVSNQFVGAGEIFDVEFHSTGQAGNQDPLVNPNFVSSATLTNDRDGGSVVYKITVFNDADGTSEVVYMGQILTSQTLIEPSTLETFNRFEVEAISGSGQGARFTSLSYTENVLPEGFTVDFDVSATDSDGDSTAVSTISIEIDPNAPSNMAVLKSLLSTELANDNDMVAGMTTQSLETSRTEMRPLEMATVAAMATGLAIPQVQQDLSQTFSAADFAGLEMVNFEYAPALDFRPMDLPETYAANFEGTVDIDGGFDFDAGMANLLGDMDGLAATSFAAAPAFEAQAADFIADMASAHEFAGGPSVFEGFAGGSASGAMEALLMLEAPAQIAEGGLPGAGGTGLGEALADLHAEAQVDAIVDHFAPTDGPAIAMSVSEGLLDNVINSGLTLHGGPLMTQEQNDEAAALAAASA